jgi:large subunit ribosomal protein L17
MRHGKKFNHLSRKSGHRKALLRNLTISLVKYKRIKTTIAKAKELRKFIEPLLTKSKNNTTHSRRVVFSYLQNKEAVTEMFNTIAPAIANRPGGYSRIIRLGFRPSDAAEVAMIELVDFNVLALESAKQLEDADKKRTRRSRKKKSDSTDEITNNDVLVNDNVSEETIEIDTTSSVTNSEEDNISSNDDSLSSEESTDESNNLETSDDSGENKE